MRKLKLPYALALAPLLLGAGGVSQSVHGLTVDKFPVCASDEYLAFQGGGIACLSLKGGSTTLPTCQGQLLTSQKNGDVNALACVAKGKGSVSDPDVQAVMNIQTNLTMVGSIITDIQNNPKSAAGVYVGSTDVKTIGQVMRTGSETGLNAANDLCGDKYPGSHLCQVYELYNTVAAGKLHKADVGTAFKEPAWVFFPAKNQPIGTPQGPNQGYADNCGSMTYPTHDRSWTGVTVSWDLLATTYAGFTFNFGNNAQCNTSHPLACCK